MDLNLKNCMLSDEGLASVAAGSCTYKEVKDERAYLLETLSGLRTSLGGDLELSTVMWLNTLEATFTAMVRFDVLPGCREILNGLIDDLNKTGLAAQVSGNPYLNILKQELL